MPPSPTFTLDDLQALAVHLHIELTPEMLIRLHHDLSEVLAHVAALQHLELPQAPVTHHAITPLRDDDAPPTTLAPDALAQMAPQMAGAWVAVPRVVDTHTEDDLT